MKYPEAIGPVTQLEPRSRERILKAKGSERPLIITQNHKATVGLQDMESFEGQRDGLLLVKFLSRSEDELREGMGVTHAAAKEDTASVLGRFED